MLRQDRSRVPSVYLTSAILRSSAILPAQESITYTLSTSLSVRSPPPLLIPKIWRAVRLATSAQPPRTTSPFSLHVSSQHTPQPMRLIVPLENPGALLEGLRCLTASRPLQTRKEFQGKTMSNFMLITDSRLSEDDRQNAFLEEVTVGP